MKDKNSNIIQNGSIIKSILYLILPIMLFMLFNSVYVNIDKFFIAGIDRTNSFYPAAVQVVFPFYFLIVGLSYLFQIGINSLVSRSIGRKDYKYISESVKTVFIVMLIISFFIIALCSLFTDIILNILGAGPNIFPYAKSYFSFIIPTILFILFNGVCAGYLLGQGYNRKVMIINVLANIINIVLDPLFIYGYSIFPKMGLAGASFATMISLIIASILYIKIIYSPKVEKILVLDKLNINIKGLKETFSVGFSGAFNPMVHSLTFLILNNVIVKIDERAFAPLSIVAAIANFGLLPSAAMFSAHITLIGQNYGAGKMERVKKALIVNPILLFTTMLIIGGFLYIFAEPLVRIFTEDQYTIEQGKLYMHIETLTYCFVGIEEITRASFTGLGKSIRPIIQILVRYFVFFIPSFFLFVYVFKLEVNSIWLSLAFSNVASGLFGLLFFSYWYSKKFSKSKPLTELSISK